MNSSLKHPYFPRILIILHNHFFHQNYRKYRPLVTITNIKQHKKPMISFRQWIGPQKLILCHNSPHNSSSKIKACLILSLPVRISWMMSRQLLSNRLLTMMRIVLKLGIKGPSVLIRLNQYINHLLNRSSHSVKGSHKIFTSLMFSKFFSRQKRIAEPGGPI